MSDQTITVLLWMLTAIFAAGVVALFRWIDWKCKLTDLTARPCPECGRAYGSESLRTLSIVKYQWTLMRGYTAATLGAPKSTFLIACPACKVETEFKDSDRVFVHPQFGVLGFSRTVKTNRAARTESVLQSAAKVNCPKKVSCPT